MNEKAMELPPHGKSAGLLGTVEWANCPLLVMQSKEREWEAGGGSRETVDISNGGKVCTRTSSGLGMFSLDRGESQDPAFYTDARLAMDLLLEGLKLPRAFGQEFVNVTSLGAPVSRAPRSLRTCLARGDVCAALCGHAPRGAAAAHTEWLFRHVCLRAAQSARIHDGPVAVHE
jgi:hypothetical protein